MRGMADQPQRPGRATAPPWGLPGWPRYTGSVTDRSMRRLPRTDMKIAAPAGGPVSPILQRAST